MVVAVAVAAVAVVAVAVVAVVVVAVVALLSRGCSRVGLCIARIVRESAI